MQCSGSENSRWMTLSSFDSPMKNMFVLIKQNKKAVLSQEKPRDASAQFDTYSAWHIALREC